MAVPSCPHCDYGVAWNTRVCPQCGTYDPLGSAVAPSDDGSASYHLGCAGLLCAGLVLGVLIGVSRGSFEASDVWLTLGISAGGVGVFILGTRIEATIRRK
jgi:hypothetical protein